MIPTFRALFLAAALALPTGALAEDLPDTEPSVHAGMMIAGWAVTLNAYALSALVGLEMLTLETSPGTYCANCSSVGPLLILPVVGPFIAIPQADGTDGKVLCSLMGAAQATGLALGIAGTAKFKRERQAQRDWRDAQRVSGSWTLLPAVASAGPGLPAVPALALDARF